MAVAQVRTTRTQSDFPTGGGELGGVIAGRDEVLGGFVDDLNAIAATLIAQVNGLHASGEGQIGYKERPRASNAVADPARTLDAAGLPFAVRHGGFDLKVVNKATGETTTTRIGIDLDGLGGNDTTLASLAASLGGVANVASSVDPNGRLTISAGDGYELRFGDDTSGALSALGVNTLFTGKGQRVDRRLSGDQGRPPSARDRTRRGHRRQPHRRRARETPSTPSRNDLGGLSVTGYYEKTVAKLAQGAGRRGSRSPPAPTPTCNRSSRSATSTRESASTRRPSRSWSSSGRSNPRPASSARSTKLFGVLLNM